MEKEGDKFIKNGMFLHNTTLGYWAEGYIKQHGGQFFDPSTNTFDWTTPLAIEALQFVVDTYRQNTSVESQAEGWPPLVKKSAAIGTAGLYMVSVYAGIDPELKVEAIRAANVPRRTGEDLPHFADRQFEHPLVRQGREAGCRLRIHEAHVAA